VQVIGVSSALQLSRRLLRQVIAYRTVSADPAAKMSVARVAGPHGRRPLAADLTVDELNVVDAVIGDRLILSELGPDEPLEIRQVEAGRASLLGSFVDAAAAWRALDDLDAPPRAG
jgi:hypothetical protein